jgi:hypothetical protein
MPFCDVQTQTGAYNPAGAWTFRGSMFSVSSRDAYVEFASTTCRSIRFVLTPSGVADIVSVGKFVAALKTDLGGIHSPGGSKTTLKNRVDIPLPSGVIVSSVIGDDGAVLSLPWRAASSTVRAAWAAASILDSSFLLVDWEGNPYEVIFSDGKVTESKGFSNSWDLDIQVVRLP